MSRFSTFVRIACLTGLLAACAKDAPPPLLALSSAKECAPQVSTSGAPALLLKAEDTSALDLIINEESACYKGADGSKSLYTVVALPDAGTEFILEVRSYQQGNSLFAPRIMLLGADNKLVREFDRKKFKFRAGVLTGLLRVHHGERYVVVATDPMGVGQQESHTVGDVGYTPVIIPLGVGMIATSVPSGSDVENKITYSYGGKVKVVVRPVPTMK